jgi:hypothetical protein
MSVVSINGKYNNTKDDNEQQGLRLPSQEKDNTDKYRKKCTQREGIVHVDIPHHEH